MNKEGYVNVRWESGDFNLIAMLPKKEFNAFVKKHCALSQLAQQLEMQYAEENKFDSDSEE
jgi:hypothetical protein